MPAKKAKMEICAPAPSKATTIIRIPLLLQKIVKHMPAETLLQLRQTCVEWNETFLPQLRQKHSPIILDYSQGSLNKYTAGMQTSKGGTIPFAKYKLDGLFVGSDTDQKIADFFSKFGSTITALEIEFEGIEKISNILYEWTPQLMALTLQPTETTEGAIRMQRKQPPKLLQTLRHLHFLCESFHANNLREILQQSAAGLQRLDLEDGEDTFLPCMRVVQDMNCAHKLKSLGTLSLDDRRGSKVILQTLIDMANLPSSPFRLRLEQLEVRFFLKDLLPQRQRQQQQQLRLFNSFMLTQASNLHQLHISFGSEYLTEEQKLNREAVHIARMEALNCFRLHHSEGWALEFEGGTLGATFPALERFAYIGKEHVGMEELGQLRHEGLTDLSWNSALNLTALRVWFPGVTRAEFKVQTDDLGELGMLWNNWPALESLKIRYDIKRHKRMEQCLHLDEFLSGVRKTEFRKIRREFGEINSTAAAVTMDDLRRILAKYKTRFGIGDQKRVQKFTVEINHLDALELTDMGGYLGLAFAPQSLDFQIKVASDAEEWPPRQARPVPWFSADCLALIRGALGPFAIINL